MEEILKTLVGEYGLAGIVIIGLVIALLKISKRQTELEDRTIELETERYKQLVSLITDNASVIAENTKALGIIAEIIRPIVKQSSEQS